MQDTLERAISRSHQFDKTRDLRPWLFRILRNLNVTSCVVSGGAVHGCIEATVREGVGLGYTFTIVPDAAYPPRSLVPDVLEKQAAFKSTAEVINDLG